MKTSDLLRACRWVLVAVALLPVPSLMSGCASSSETAERDALTAHVGMYPPPPPGAALPRVGVPPFSVKAGAGFGGGSNLDALAADQMTTLLTASDRFRVIERAQLQKLLDEQNLEGIVRPGEMAKPAQVRGVDFLLIGKVTDLSVKREKQSSSFGLGRIGGMLNMGAADVKKTNVTLTTQAGVDIRLVNPTSGEVLVASSSEYKKTDQAGAFGLDILGANADASADLQMTEDNKGKILRLALDDALRKSLPKIDRFLLSNEARALVGSPAAPSQPAMPAAPVNGGSSAPTAAPAAAKKFCAHCGAKLEEGAKFCPNCGAPVQ